MVYVDYTFKNLNGTMSFTTIPPMLLLSVTVLNGVSPIGGESNLSAWELVNFFNHHQNVTLTPPINLIEMMIILIPIINTLLCDWFSAINST